jgi:hypothetical protein
VGGGKISESFAHHVFTCIRRNSIDRPSEHPALTMRKFVKYITHHRINFLITLDISEHENEVMDEVSPRALPSVERVNPFVYPPPFYKTLGVARQQ